MSPASELMDTGFEDPTVGNGTFQPAPVGTPWMFSGTAGISGNNSINAGNGISAISASSLLYLGGVFLNGLETGTQSPPAALNFTSSGLT